MELVLGTETTNEFYTFELVAAAQKLVGQIMLTQPGEEVAITVDTAGDWRVAKAAAQAAYALGARPTLILYQTQPDAQMEPPAPVGLAVAGADVWIDFAVQYILYTEARQKATEAGCRHACMAGMDVDTLVRTIGRVDYPKMMAVGDEIVRLHNESKTIRVQCALGTDLSAELDGNAGQSGGLATKKGALVMLGGQAGCLPKEETIEGKIVLDGMIWPPNEIGLLREGETVTLQVEKGSIVSVEGEGAAAIYRAWLESFGDANIYRMAHYCYGYNPGVTRLTGRVVEDERLFGSITFGFGATSTREAPSHTDCLLRYPTIHLDEVEMERDGKYTHPTLVKLCQELRAPGY
jgi:leucyl aminopeptidase (aminopeptidase T)